MKGWLAKNKVKGLAIIGILLLLVVGIVISVFLLGRQKDKPSNVGDPEKQINYEFKRYPYEAEYLDNHDDIGAMILDCDSTASFTKISNVRVTTMKGEYVQGAGAFDLSILRETITAWGIFDAKDISDYADGSVHVSLYISDTKYLGDIPVVFELTSSGKYDVDEIAWVIEPQFLKSGWNELYLGIPDAFVLGEPDLTALNFFRMYALGGSMGLEVFMDCVYATDTPGMDLKGPKEYASAKKGYLLDFDTLGGLNSSGAMSLSNTADKYKEGKAGLAIENPKTLWVQADLNMTDVSGYQRGTLSFWMYINNEEYVRDRSVTVELTSSGTCDLNEISWVIPGGNLKTGWNEVVLSFAKAKQTSDEPIDLTKVNYLRIFALNCNPELSLIIDGGALWTPTTRVSTDGTIIDCDTLDDFLSVNEGVSITSEAGEYKEGTGAVKMQVSSVLWLSAEFKDLVDVSDYADGGVHLWLYVDDVSKMKSALTIELSSGGTYDVDEYQWRASGLKNGWNELKLGFEDAEIIGTPDLESINYVRLYAGVSGEITVILDDIRAVESVKEELPEGTTVDTAVDGMIFSGDSLEYAKIKAFCAYEITRENGEYLQGTGALKLTGASTSMGLIELWPKEAVDISAYAEGGIQFSLYVGDMSALTSTLMTFELTSSGVYDQQELAWHIPTASLTEGWNTVTLLFEDAEATGGDIDFAGVDYVRLYTSTKESSQSLVLIIDNVHAVLETGGGDNAGDDEDSNSNGWNIISKDKIITSGSDITPKEMSADVSGADAEDLVLYFEVTIPDSLYETMKSGKRVRIGIGQAFDSLELVWNVPMSDVTAGTNVFKLPLSEPSEIPGGQDAATILNQPLTALRIFYNTSSWGAGYMVGSTVNEVKIAYKEDITLSEITTCSYLRNGAVYQADKELVIWGTTDSDAEITAQLYRGETLIAENTVSAVEGEWELTLPGQTGGYTAYTIKLSVNGKETASYTDILFGEVWLAAGQSNMQLTVQDSYEGTEQIEAAKDNYLRLFQAVAMPEGYGARTTPATDIAGQWIMGDTKDVGVVSAVAYNFALGLRSELDVPVAILETSMGSTTIEAWLSKEIVDTDSELRAEMEKLGVYKTPTTYTELGAMYYSKIAPLSHVNITGVIWYQGEGNVGRASIYAEQLDLLKAKWGEAFGFENDSMPFIFTQLAPYSYENYGDQMAMTEMMDAMSTFYGEHETTAAMVTIYDLSLRYMDATHPAVIHPTVKKPVGERMALAAMGLVYDEEEATAPTLESCTIENGKAILKFSHVGTGLKVCDDSNGVLGFALCDASGVWVNATAEIIDTTTVRVYSDFVENPLYVSYAYCDMNTDANLCASNGIPAAPFTTGGTGGLGSRSYLNCDEEIFVVNAAGQGEYKNLWTIVNRSTNSFDSSCRVQGLASVKSVYEAGKGEVITGIDLSEARRCNATAGLKNIAEISIKMKNADARQKDVRLAITAANGTTAFTAKQSLAANTDFATVLFDLTELYDENGNTISDTQTVCDNMVKLAFYIDDTQAGAVWIDDIKLGGDGEGSLPVTPGMILSCDSYDDANIFSDSRISVTAEERECLQGSGALKTTGAGQVRLKATLYEAKDISAYQTGGIELSLYIGDKSIIASSSILVELSSSGKADTEELCWEIPLADLQDDWNTVELQFADAIASGEIDYTAVDFLRIYFSGQETNENIIFIIDDVRAVKGSNEEDSGMILDCDSTEGMTVTSNSTYSITNAENEYVQGTGAFKSVGNGVVWWAVKLENAMNLSVYENGGIRFWLYISDPSLLNNNPTVDIELGSAGKSDTNEYQWTLPTAGLQKGWQEIYLDFASAYEVGSVDINNINWFRIYGGVSDVVTVMLDDVRAISQDEETVQNEWILATVDQISGGKTGTGTTTSEDAPGAGVTFANMSLASGNVFMVGQVLESTPNFGEYTKEDLALAFWYYAETAGTLAGTQIELSSNVDDMDNNEMTWYPPLIQVQAGWNYIELPLDGSNVADTTYNCTDTFDLNNIETIRWFKTNSTTSSFKVTDLKIVVLESQDEEPVQSEWTLVTAEENGNKVSTGVTVSGEAPGEGVTYANMSIDSGTKYIAYKTFTALDFGNYSKDDLALSFWYYSDTAGTLPGGWGQIELSSSTTDDVEEMYCQPRNITVQAGWNYIELPLTDAYFTDVASCDISNLVRIRWYKTGNACDFKITDLKIVVLNP